METLKAFSEEETGDKQVKYPLLSDPESELIRGFGILNEKIREDHTWYGVPYPHVYLINTEGVIVGKFFESRYQDRPTAESILTYIKQMQSESGNEAQNGAPDK